MSVTCTCLGRGQGATRAWSRIHCRSSKTICCHLHVKLFILQRSEDIFLYLLTLHGVKPDPWYVERTLYRCDYVNANTKAIQTVLLLGIMVYTKSLWHMLSMPIAHNNRSYFQQLRTIVAKRPLQLVTHASFKLIRRVLLWVTTKLETAAQWLNKHRFTPIMTNDILSY